MSYKVYEYYSGGFGCASEYLVAEVETYEEAYEEASNVSLSFDTGQIIIEDTNDLSKVKFFNESDFE